MAIALIASGGNLGDPRETIRRAWALMGTDAGVRLVAVSRMFTTAPVGTDAGGVFVNAAASVDTSLAPESLLDLLQSIEQRLGRVRTLHWGPRSIDLDLIGYDDLVLNSPRLNLPHPAAWYRRFVLDPLHDVAANWEHPLLCESVGQLRERLQPRPLVVSARLGEASAAPFIERVSNEFQAGELLWTEDATEAALAFVVNRQNSGIGREIVLPNESAAEFAVQVLRAALDLPVVLPIECGD